MSFEEFLLFAAHGDTKLALDLEFRKHQAPNWLRYLKEKEYEDNA
jgi:hypothetical protein